VAGLAGQVPIFIGEQAQRRPSRAGKSPKQKEINRQNVTVILAEKSLSWRLGGSESYSFC
jgi:hypothetical protein